MQSLFYNFITFINAHSKLNGKVIASQWEEILLDMSSTSIDGAICIAVCFASVENAKQYVLPFARYKDLLTVAKLQRRKGSIQDTQADTHTHVHTNTHDLNHGYKGRFHFRVIFMSGVCRSCQAKSSFSEQEEMYHPNQIPQLYRITTPAPHTHSLEGEGETFTFCAYKKYQYKIQHV